jgi:hypothetical protein
MSALISGARQPDFPEVDALFAKALAKLAQCHARISVVGQVKAGKSSLINVLIGQPDLLPTEVNPWTAVITNLQFGHPDKPHSGGAFQLFSEEEWQRMIEGDSKTRALAEALLPGFDSETLKRQVQEMQDTAKQRLGALYRHLLGKKHSFSTITPEILERYVSAGHQAADAAEVENAGRFSGITKSAEVYLEAAPFALPVTLSDTPGINDPFLVRDEITTSSFRDTDIYVVALSIHQALSAADMALLRMLTRHSGKHIIVFVNRIDEADTPAEDVPAVMAALQARLDAELRVENITLIEGSAHWGGLALFGSDEEVTAALNAPGCAGYCPKSGPARERLYQGAGFPALAEALSAAIDSGPVTRDLAEIASEVRAAFEMQENAMQDRLAHEDVVLMEVGDIPAILEAEKNRLITRINQLADLADDLDAGEDKARAKLLENADVVSRSIANTVEATLGKFIDAQISRMKAGFDGSESVKAWSLDTASLHEKIETQVVQSFAKGRQELDTLFADYAQNTCARMAAILGEINTDGLLENLPHEAFLPGYKPGNTAVNFVLEKDNGWKFWKKSEMTQDEALARLQQVIRQESLPAITACCDAARQAIAERTGEAQSRIARIKQAARALVVDEVTTMKAEIETLDQGVSADVVTKLNRNRKVRAEDLRARLAALGTARAALRMLFPETLGTQSAPVSGGDA